MRRSILVIAVMLLLPSFAFATPDRAAGGGQSPEEKFAAMDKNGDGSVSREEFFQFYPNMHESAFKAIDKDGSNTLSLEEWLAFSGKHARDMGGSGMSMPGAPGKGSTGAQMSGQSSGQTGQGIQENKPAKPLFEFSPKNDAQ